MYVVCDEIRSVTSKWNCIDQIILDIYLKHNICTIVWDKNPPKLATSSLVQKMSNGSFHQPLWGSAEIRMSVFSSHFKRNYKTTGYDTSRWHSMFNHTENGHVNEDYFRAFGQGCFNAGAYRYHNRFMECPELKGTHKDHRV